MEKFSTEEKNVDGKKLETQLESERTLLAENIEEISGLVEKKTTGWTDQAKLLAARCGKVAGVGLAAAGGIGALGITGLELQSIIENTHEGVIAPLSIDDKQFLLSVQAITVFAGMLGVVTIDKFQNIIAKLKEKLG
jgi:hypothetical protein